MSTRLWEELDCELSADFSYVLPIGALLLILEELNLLVVGGTLVVVVVVVGATPEPADIYMKVSIRYQKLCGSIPFKKKG